MGEFSAGLRAGYEGAELSAARSTGSETRSVTAKNASCGCTACF